MRRVKLGHAGSCWVMLGYLVKPCLNFKATVTKQQQGLGMWLIGRALTQHAWTPGFDP